MKGYQGGPPLQVVYGRKARLAVALTPSSNGDLAPIWSVETEPTSAASTDIHLPPAADGRLRTVVFMTGSAGTSAGALRFIQRTRVPKEVSIDLKIGGTSKLERISLTVTKIEKLSAADEDRFFVRYRPAWRVVIERGGTSNRHLEFFPVDPYLAVRADGRGASIESFHNGKITDAPADALHVQSIFFSELPEGAVAVLLDRDPAKVKHLTLGGNEIRTTSMQGIPFDPK